MRAGGAQILGLFGGVMVMGAYLLAIDGNGIGGVAGAGATCHQEQSADDQNPSLAPISQRLSMVELPAPPPLPIAKPTVGAEAAPRPARRPAERPSPRRARIDLASAAPNMNVMKPAKQELATETLTPKIPVSAPDTALSPLKVGKGQESAGRPLLRLLEHGSGFSVEIAWPEHAVARAKLYDLLRRCHGLKTVLIRDQEILMPAVRGATETFNTDRHSGFLRAIFGPSPRHEGRVISRLQKQHGMPGTEPARLLSRQFDARLLGGLRHLVGGGYREARSVTARYAIAGERVMINGISVDGRGIKGWIEIDPPGRCRGGGA
jgi:hypothetical protein